MNIKIIGILVGITGLGLFAWHQVKVATDTETSQGFGTHHLWSLVGGLLILAGTAIYIVGRGRRSSSSSSSSNRKS